MKTCPECNEKTLDIDGVCDYCGYEEEAAN